MMKRKKESGIIAEFEKHYGTIAMFPYRNDIWREDAIYMQKYILELVNIIARYEPVYLFCHKDLIKKVKEIPNNVIIVKAEYDDIWARDICPTFIKNDGRVECIDWKFNAWGGKKDGAYFPWEADDRFASVVASYFGLLCKRNDIILEGGAIVSDGKGTIFTTRSVLLNRNRNPFKKKEIIEKNILEATGDKQIIWIDQGLAYDETNGHIDNLLAFVDSNEICLAWTDDKYNPNYRRVRNAYKTVSKIHNMYGEKYKINLIPLPSIQYMKKEEAEGLWSHPEALSRNGGDILPASYLNYYVLNGAVIIPSFDCEYDASVKTMFETMFPQKDIIQIYSREPLLGGGGIHCLLHHIPLMEG